MTNITLVCHRAGAWDVPEIFRIPEDVTIVNECDLEEQARRLQDVALSARSGDVVTAQQTSMTIMLLTPLIHPTQSAGWSIFHLTVIYMT